MRRLKLWQDGGRPQRNGSRASDEGKHYQVFPFSYTFNLRSVLALSWSLYNFRGLVL